MRTSDSVRKPIAAEAVFDPELLRFGSLLIYCRSSFTLSLLVYSFITAMLYSDLYVHLIRQSADSFVRSSVFPGFFFASLVAGCAYLARRMKPRAEKAALVMLATNFGVLFFRMKMEANSGAYLALCTLSLLLDLGLLSAVIVFYRKYPNYLKILRAGKGA